MTPSRLVLTALAAASVACTTSTEPEWIRAPGLVLDGPPPLNSLTAPDTVRVGQQFQVIVSTWGSSTCTRPDGYDLGVTPSRAKVVPYDLTPVGEIHCTDDLRSFPRTLLLTFPTAGQAEIEVEGRGFDEKPLRISATVTVLPE